MPLCSNGQSPIIQWQYPGKEVNRIVGADNYILELDWYGGQNPNIKYNLKYGLASANSNGFLGWTIYYAQLESLTPPFSAVRLLISGIDYGILEHWSFRGLGSSAPIDGGRTRPYAVDIKDVTGIWRRGLTITSSNGFKVYGFEPLDGSTESNPEGGNCTFKVSKNGGVMYQKTDIVCPTVNVICDSDQCPPNTCECTNGSLVCCYDSTGRAVKSFMR